MTTEVIYRIACPFRAADIEVYGDPAMGWYEYRIVAKGTVERDTGRHGSYGMQYGSPEIALRDALIEETA